MKVIMPQTLRPDSGSREGPVNMPGAAEEEVSRGVGVLPEAGDVRVLRSKYGLAVWVRLGVLAWPRAHTRLPRSSAAGCLGA